jgi:putative transposase
VKKAYLYRLYPTREQRALLQQQLDVAREVYNACLLERREAYRMCGTKLNYYDQANQLKDIRRDRPDVAAVNFSMLQAICRRAQRSFENFYRRVAAGQDPGYPRFKGRSRFDSVTFPSYGDGCKLRHDRLYIQGVGTLKVKLHRAVAGRIKTVTLKRSCGQWYVVLTCEVETRPLPATGQDVGIDLGLIDFLVTQRGDPVPAPRYFRRGEAILARRQRIRERKRRGGKNRRKAGLLVARAHRHVTNQRKDFHHKTAHDLVAAYDAIYHEDLAVKNMVQNHSLAKSISDAGWAQFIAILTSKAEEAGRAVIAVNPRGTSQTCICGEPVPKDLSQRWHRCPRCHLSLPRDQVSAMIIHRLGSSLQALEPEKLPALAGRVVTMTMSHRLLANACGRSTAMTS